jgi:hypothetical protein
MDTLNWKFEIIIMIKYIINLLICSYFDKVLKIIKICMRQKNLNLETKIHEKICI